MKLNFLLLITIIVLNNKIDIAQSIWDQIDGINGGLISSLYVDESGKWFAGTNNGSIFSSTNTGDDWELNIFLDYNSRITGFVKTDYLFAGTLERGIYRSTDDGINWIEKNNGLAELIINSLVVDSKGWLYAAHSNQYLSRSTDNGESWSMMNNGLLSNCVYSLSVDTLDFIYAGTSNGLYKSTNSGVSWDLVYQDLYIREILDLQINSQNNIFIGNNGGLYRSTDSGLSWIRLPTGNYPDQIIAVNLSKDDKIFISTNNGIYRSVNNGDDWTYLHINLLDSTYQLVANAFAFPDNNSLIIGAINQGIYYSSDNGNSWLTKNNGINAFSIFSVNFGNNGLILVGIEQGAANFISLDGGQTWRHSYDGIAGARCMATIGEKIFIGNDNTLFMSSDFGNSWIMKNNGLTPGNIRGLFFDKKINTLFTGTSRGIYKSNDEGENWIYTGLNGIKIIGIAQDKDGVIYASAIDGTYLCYLYYSTDYGNTWIQTNLISIGMSSPKINNKGTIFISSFTFHSSGVHKSTDMGLTWDYSNIGLEDTLTKSIELNQNGDIFVLTSTKGVFKSSDEGTSWSKFNEGIWNSRLMNIAVDSAGFLYVGTRGSGVFKTIKSSITNIVEPIQTLNNYLLQQNYPNPFNPSTSIQYSIGSKQFITLKVYDVLGNEVTTLVNEYREAGSYSITFDAVQLPSGVYIYKIQAGDFVSSKKMLLLK
jgi:photosystem II stability/assembly factor-like uncharacterized protein